MGTAILIVGLIGIVGGLVWVLLTPSPETTMGRENKALKEAKKAQEPHDEGTDR